MARKRQEIKVVLHKPEKMDSDRSSQIEDFWEEVILQLIEKCNLTEDKRKYLRQYIDNL